MKTNSILFIIRLCPGPLDLINLLGFFSVLFLSFLRTALCFVLILQLDEFDILLQNSMQEAAAAASDLKIALPER